MFYQVLGTTLIYLFGVVPPIVIGALALAVLVNRILPGVHILRAAFYTPVLVSIVWLQSPFVGFTPKTV